MTLIFNVVTPVCIVQVSDRRLTDLNTGDLVDDETNKVVLFCNRMAFSYTGLAQIGNLRTDIWLTSILADSACVMLPDAIDVIKEKSTQRFRTIPLTPKQKRHAFVGIGWTKPPEQTSLLPILCTISNYYSQEGRRTPTAADNFSVIRRVFTKATECQFLSIGLPLLKTELNDILRTLRKRTRKSVDPQVIVEILVRNLRKTAKRTNSVGESILAVIIPKPEQILAEETDVEKVVSSPPFLPQDIGFLYYPRGENNGVIYGPNFVCAGKKTTGWRARPKR